MIMKRASFMGRSLAPIMFAGRAMRALGKPIGAAANSMFNITAKGAGGLGRRIIANPKKTALMAGFGWFGVRPALKNLQKATDEINSTPYRYF